MPKKHKNYAARRRAHKSSRQPRGRTSEYSSVIIIQGPGIKDAKAINNFYQEYNKKKVFIFGDGKEDLNTEEIPTQLLRLKNSGEIGSNPLIVYNMHGNMDEEDGFVVQTGKEEVFSGKDLITEIHDVLEEDLDMILYSCHSGGLLEEIEDLPFVKRLFAASSSKDSTHITNTHLINAKYLAAKKKFTFENYIYTSLSHVYSNTRPVIFDRDKNFRFDADEAKLNGYQINKKLKNYFFRKLINSSSNWQELSTSLKHAFAAQSPMPAREEPVTEELIQGLYLANEKGEVNNIYLNQALDKLEKRRPDLVLGIRGVLNMDNNGEDEEDEEWTLEEFRSEMLEVGSI